ncbi:MAG: hypothetical protein AB1689_25205 [Thermodesulfobacteriota bacterium]
MAASDDGRSHDPSLGPGSDGAVLLALLLRGALGAEDLASASGTMPADVTCAVDRLQAEHLVGVEARPAGSAFTLTALGRERAVSVLAQEAASLRPLIEPRYGEFAALNRRVKATLHRWQVRHRRGLDELNDHRDARYDGQVLAELRATHAAADAWLAPLAAVRARYASLRDRLATMVARALSGDKAAVAGVTADSFHLAWWQLHADLLQVLGRERGPDDV